ncbi:MAG: hypothetical protein AAGA30_01935 [Planctomycetota bacterium]
MSKTTDTFIDEFQTFAPGRRLRAGVLSLVLHLLLFVGLFAILLQVKHGSGEVENKTGGIVLVDLSSETTEFLTEGELSDSSASEDQPSAPPLLANDELPPDLPGLEFNDSVLTGVGEDFSDALAGVESMTQGTQSSQPLGGKVTTSVFGVKGTGSRFVYVFDRSASMEDLGGKPLRAAKAQLRESLDSLAETSQFQIIFYNDRTKSFRSALGDRNLVVASKDEKIRADRFIDSIRGKRGTDHLGALRLALSYGPDVVFLLTDAEGGFSSGELAAIAEWNRSGAVINAIEFGVGSQRAGDRSLRRVAEQSLGQYIYKDARTFRD